MIIGRPGRDVVKVLDKNLILGAKVLDVLRLQMSGPQWPEDPHTTLKVNHFVYANKPVGMGAEVASGVLDPGHKSWGRYGAAKVGDVACAVKRRLAAENSFSFQGRSTERRGRRGGCKGSGKRFDWFCQRKREVL